jgi:hypothetical protein
VPAEEKKRKRKGGAADTKVAGLFQEQYKQYWLPDVQEVPVEDIVFDTEAVENQVRVLDKAVVDKRVTSMRTVEPDDLLELRLLEQDLAGVHCGPILSHGQKISFPQGRRRSF